MFSERSVLGLARRHGDPLSRQAGLTTANSAWAIVTAHFPLQWVRRYFAVDEKTVLHGPASHAVEYLAIYCEQAKHVRLITQEIWTLKPDTPLSCSCILYCVALTQAARGRSTLLGMAVAAASPPSI